MKTKGQIEAEIGEAITKFEKEYMGRGPIDTQTYLVEDMVIVRLRGVLTPAEQQLAKADDPSRGCRLIKEARGELLESARMLLATVVQGITGRGVVSLHTDISVTVGERVIIFTLDGQPACGEKQTEQNC